jgi:hypothetical protein
MAADAAFEEALQELNIACKPTLDRLGPKATATALLTLYAMLMEHLAWRALAIDQMETILSKWRAGQSVLDGDGDKLGSA